ncbi:MAG: esterase [Lachnospiraceae bacterium]|nr:esterase [Lachnospiraceae bacterium]
MTYTYGNPNANTLLIQMIDDHDLKGLENEAEEIRDRTDKDFYLIGIKVQSWNDDLSPWEAPAVFGKDGFGGRAGSTLDELMPLCADRNRTYYIGGYSLAALFALWAAYQTDIFKGVAAASPSMWFPRFADYMKENRIKADSVYLSLGDKEEKVKNPVMATVGDRIREAADVLKGQDVNTILEWNEGNHFKDAGIRTAKAFAWLLGA